MLWPDKARTTQLTFTRAHMLAFRLVFALAMLAAAVGGWKLQQMLVAGPGAMLVVESPIRETTVQLPPSVGPHDVAPPSTLFLARVRAWKLGLGTSPAGHQLLGGRVDPRWARAAGPASKAPDTLLWPVTHGWFVRGYGSGEDGYHLAVDIGGMPDSLVRAAADGIVGYAGDGIRGYGNVVLLVHPGGVVTFYAHNHVDLVVAGQRVRRGQPIALLGTTGISKGPHVHFELIYDGRNCDPLALFRPAALHRNGKPAEVTQTRWKPTDGPSDAIPCAPRRRFPHSRWVD